MTRFRRLPEGRRRDEAAVRQERLARALRDNLRRRKDQIRERTAGGTVLPPAAKDGDEPAT